MRYALGKHAASLSDTGQGWLEAHWLVTADGSQIGYHDLGPAFQYLTCLHYAISSTVLGSLSINPTNSVERGFTVGC